MKLSANKKSLISDLREKLAENQIKPGALVEKRPTPMGDDAYMAIEDPNEWQKAYLHRSVDSGELMLYLDFIEVLDENGELFRHETNHAHKFLWGTRIIYLMVKRSNFIRDFQRHFRLVKGKK